MHRRVRPVRRRKNARGRDKGVISGHGRADIGALEDPWKARSCPLWVISGHCDGSIECPLYPQKGTLVECVGMSALCQKRTLALRCGYLVLKQLSRSLKRASAEKLATLELASECDHPIVTKSQKMLTLHIASDGGE